jgi:hypothetical protein
MKEEAGIDVGKREVKGELSRIERKGVRIRFVWRVRTGRKGFGSGWGGGVRRRRMHLVERA